MISYVVPNPEAHEQYVERLVKGASHQEFTSSGFPYYVSDSERVRKDVAVPLANGEKLEALVITSDLRDDLRESLGEACVRSFMWHEDPLAIAIAAREAQGPVSPPWALMAELAEEDSEAASKWEIRPDDVLVDIGGDSVLATAIAVQAHKNRFGRLIQKHGKDSIPKLTREQVYYGLGWTQSFRWPDPESTWRVISLGQEGKWTTPRVGEGTRLEAPITRKSGKQEQVGIVMNTEEYTTHTCVRCHSHIWPKSERVTYQLPDHPRRPSDHEHLHAVCYFEGGPPSLDPTQMAIRPIPDDIQASMNARQPR
jgi:hypothetical protein